MDIRPIDSSDLDAFMDLMEVAYLDDFGEERRRHYRTINEPDRSFGAFDDAQLVGTISAYSFNLTVPGQRTLPMAGTTVVAVRPTHRRRGILRHLIDTHFADVRRRGEPLAGLWASEAPIYGRFGYGCAADFVALEIRSDQADIDGPIDDRLDVRMVDKAAFEDTAKSLYEARRSVEPGALTRTANWWTARRLLDLDNGRGGASSFRYALVRRQGSPVGYVQYRTKDVARDGIAAGEIRVAELLALDVDAELALWRFLFDIDLTVMVKAPFRSMADPLFHRLVDRRTVKISTSDGLYLRLMDVSKALTGRRYAEPGMLTIEVTDHNDIAGVYRLEIDAQGEANCRCCEAPAELALDAKTLAAAYLGGHRIRDLARAGRIIGSAEAIGRADIVFSGQQAPIAREIF